MTSGTGSEQPARIPFWRNVKTIGIFLQLVFVVTVIVLALGIFNNVSSALARTHIPANFDFLTARAGVPIAETPIPYTPQDPYWRALVIGLLNTLRVALVGVVLATIVGVVVGVMRISGNFLARQVATGYVELLRNTPLAVQIIFWYTAVLSVIPPLSSNPITLPGGVLISNIGIALPWVFPSYSFAGWWPWLIGAAILGVAIWLWRRAAIRRADRPGMAWPAGLAAGVVVAVVGFFVVGSGTTVPDSVDLDYLVDRGRGTAFIDSNGNGRYDAASERTMAYLPVTARIDEGRLTATTSNVLESAREVSSTFRFPLVSEGEFETAEVSFVNEEDDARFDIHFTQFPSRGIIYEDRDGNGEWDEGEELNPETGRGFSGVRLHADITGFERYVVADREGQIRLPRFEPASAAEESAGGAAAPVGAPTSLFGPPPGAAEEEVAEVVFSYEIGEAGPLVWSRPSVAVSTYDGGIRLSTSYLAMLLALVVYTAAFMAEIVRAGIQAVPRGQTEAARALGIRPTQIFSLIVFPQALRIIMPPMISQYLNLTKNSSLAPLAAYGELFAISVIVANQTGASVPVTLLLIVAYVVISLIFAFILNIVNARMALVER